MIVDIVNDNNTEKTTSVKKCLFNTILDIAIIIINIQVKLIHK